MALLAQWGVGICPHFIIIEKTRAGPDPQVLAGEFSTFLPSLVAGYRHPHANHLCESSSASVPNAKRPSSPPLIWRRDREGSFAMAGERPPPPSSCVRKQEVNGGSADVQQQ